MRPITITADIDSSEKSKKEHNNFFINIMGNTDTMRLIISNLHLLNNVKHTRKGKTDKSNLTAEAYNVFFW